jgi:uncharacterized protein Usg
MNTLAMTPLERQLRGWRLTTAEILYRMPDHPSLLQSYIWQELDKAPDFPELHRFLEFWERRLDGKLHSVTVTACAVVTPGELRAVEHVGWLH